MRRVRKSRSRREWSDAHLLQLRTGFDFFGESWGDHPSAADLDEMKTAWEDCQDAVLAEHIERFPCSRPWAWWEFSSPEPRDESKPEREQLIPLGVLGRDEIHRHRRMENHNTMAARSGFDAQS